jgi:hypothetical protein
MNATQLNARNAIIASFSKSLSDTVATMQTMQQSELDQFIIMCDGLAIDVDGKPGLGGMVVPVIKATRFGLREEAAAMAARVVNGRGDRGTAIRLRDALDAAITDYAKQIVNLV